MVMLSFPAANCDPEMFPDADKVVIDRPGEPARGLGLGIHRCVGSNLARHGDDGGGEEVLRRLPEFVWRATLW